MDLVISPLPLIKLTSFYIAKRFWNKSFKAERLQLSRYQHDTERNWEIYLTTCRDEAIRRVIIFLEKDKLILPLKNLIPESMFLLHQAYHQLLLWKLNYDQNNKIDIMEEGEFYAPNFFTADGIFNDRAWVKCLMRNQSYPTSFLFSLAFAYNFEKDICSLWKKLLPLEDIPSEDGFNFFGVCTNFRSFKRIFEQSLIQFCVTEHRERDEVVFNPEYFSSLVKNGYEYTIYSWWEIMSNSQKLDLMTNDRYFEMINGNFFRKSILDFPRRNISYFLYSQLSDDRKKDLFQWYLRRGYPGMWLSLLLTSNGDLHFEILKFICDLPSYRSSILFILSRRIRRLKLPSDAKLFETLCNKIPLEKYRQLMHEDGKIIFENLFKAKSFHNIRCMIERFSYEQKLKFLLNGSYGAGIKFLDVLCKEGEFDLLEKYLSFFLKDEVHNGEYNLRRRNVLKKFIESSEFHTWCLKKLSKQEQTEVKSLIEALLTQSYNQQNYCKKKNYESKISPRFSLFEKHFT